MGQNQYACTRSAKAATGGSGLRWPLCLIIGTLSLLGLMLAAITTSVVFPAGPAGRSAGVGDRYPAAFCLGLWHRDADLKDPLVVGGRDVLGICPVRQYDRPGERAVPEL